MSLFTDARHWSRYVGPRTVASAAAGWAAHRLVGHGHEVHSPPSLDDMVRAGGGRFAESADDLLAALGWHAEDVAPLRAEFAEVSHELEERRLQVGPELPYPDRYAVQEQTGLFLYALVRLLRPATVVETGVANGRSSFLVLRALQANRAGTLHSYDVAPDVGVLVEDHDRWELVLSPEEEDAPRTLRAGLQALGAVDVFFHDSDHRYLNQWFEYHAAWSVVRPGGVLASDDVDDSRAFLDFTAEVGRSPQLLFDHTKVVGAVRV